MDEGRREELHSVFEPRSEFWFHPELRLGSSGDSCVWFRVAGRWGGTDVFGKRARPHARFRAAAKGFPP